MATKPTRGGTPPPAKGGSTPRNADRADTDEPAPGDPETLSGEERARFEDEAMRERDA